MNEYEKTQLKNINFKEEMISIYGSFFVGEALEETPRIIFIKKTNGKYRRVFVPTFKVLSIQKYIYNILKNAFSPSNISYAYHFKRNVLDNAKVHINSKYVLKLDITNFFNEITETQIIDLLSKKISSNSAKFIAKISTYKGKLYIGSVLAPILSNELLKLLDCDLERKFPQLKISRYADDFTFSSEFSFNHKEVEDFVSDELVKLGLKLNTSKTKWRSNVEQFFVTGISVYQGKASLSRKQWDKYTEIIKKTFKKEYLSSKEVEKVQGIINWLNMINKDKLIDFLFIIWPTFKPKFVISNKENKYKIKNYFEKALKEKVKYKKVLGK